MGSVVEETWGLDIFSNAIELANNSDPNELLQAFKTEFSIRFSPDSDLFTGPSARVLLKELFISLKKHGYKDVWLCNYNCPVVFSAAEIVGLPVNFYSAELLWGDEVAINNFYGSGRKNKSIWVIPHFFGRPSNLPFQLPDGVRERFFIIEDCAHTLGASLKHKHLGTHFDAGLFSFNLDKPISLLGGGILSINSKQIDPRSYIFNDDFCDDDTELLKQALEDWNYIRKLIRTKNPILKLAYKVKLKLILGNIPQTSFLFGPARSALGLAALRDFDMVRQEREFRAERIFGPFSQTLLPLPDGAKTSYLRKRILVPNDMERAKFIKSLKSKGILCGNLNWRLTGSRNASQFDREWSERGLDIPIDLFLTTKEEEVIKEALSEIEFSSL